MSYADSLLELRTSGNESLTSFVSLVLLEILDEASCEILSLLFPYRSVSVSVARIEDLRINTRKFSRNNEVEVRNCLSRSLIDRTIEDSVDDTTSIADRDTLTRTIPTSVNEICLSTVSFHLLYEFCSILSGVQFEECLAEAS